MLVFRFGLYPSAPVFQLCHLPWERGARLATALIEKYSCAGLCTPQKGQKKTGPALQKLNTFHRDVLMASTCEFIDTFDGPFTVWLYAIYILAWVVVDYSPVFATEPC